MAGFNMPFISQQIIQDAFAMSTPVEASDEKFLLQALIDSRSKKETYKDALNGLHGVCNFLSRIIHASYLVYTEEWSFRQSLEGLLSGTQGSAG